MKRFSIFISILAAILLVSGSCAIFLDGNVGTENSFMQNNAQDENLSNDNSINSDVSFSNTTNNNDDILELSEPQTLKKQVLDTNLYTFASDNLDDRYYQCAECGKYIPLGKVNKNLPDSAICNEFRGEGVIGIENSVSYEQAYTDWETFLSTDKYSQNINYHEYTNYITSDENDSFEGEESRNSNNYLSNDNDNDNAEIGINQNQVR